MSEDQKKTDLTEITENLEQTEPTRARMENPLVTNKSADEPKIEQTTQSSTNLSDVAPENPTSPQIATTLETSSQEPSDTHAAESTPQQESAQIKTGAIEENNDTSGNVIQNATESEPIKEQAAKHKDKSRRLFAFNDELINQIPDTPRLRRFNFTAEDYYLNEKQASIALKSLHSFNTQKIKFLVLKPRRDDRFEEADLAKLLAGNNQHTDKPDPHTEKRPDVVARRNNLTQKIEVLPFSGTVDIEYRSTRRLLTRCHNNTVVLQSCLLRLGCIPTNISDLEFHPDVLHDLTPRVFCFFSNRIPVTLNPLALNGEIQLDSTLDANLRIDNGDQYAANRLVELICQAIVYLGLENEFLANGKALSATFSQSKNPKTDSDWSKAFYTFAVDIQRKGLYYNYFYNTSLIVHKFVETERQKSPEEAIIPLALDDRLLRAWLESELLHRFHANGLQWEFYIRTALEQNLQQKNLPDSVEELSALDMQFRILRDLRITRNIPVRGVMEILRGEGLKDLISAFERAKSAGKKPRLSQMHRGLFH